MNGDSTVLDEFDLTGRVAIVTGGGAGIGAATALLLSRRGAQIVIAARTAEALEQRAAGITAATGGRCVAIPTDVREEEQIQRLVQRTLDEFGRIDILINNAGGSRPAPAASVTAALWENNFSFNVTSAVLCSREVLSHFKERRSGAIVNVSSLAGVNGTKGHAPYSAAKAAVQMYTRVAAAEWGGFGIRVNCVAPGMIATEHAIAGWGIEGLNKSAAENFPLGRPGRPDEVAQAIVFLASDAASYITGETLVVGGGPQIKGQDDR